jgi:hypothetical protein
VLCPRTFYTDLNGLSCKVFKAEVTLVREGYFRGEGAMERTHDLQPFPSHRLEDLLDGGPSLDSLYS